MSALVGVYGAGGMGREIMAVVRAQLSPDTVLVFIDDDPAASGEANGCPIVSFEQFIGLEADRRSVTVSVSESRIRERLSLRCDRAGVPPLEVRAPHTFVGDAVKCGPGMVLHPFASLTCNIVIGRGFQANVASAVAHDCRIGDFVTFAPGAKCNGNVRIGDHAYVGAGAVIRQGRADRPVVIGVGAVIGMGAVVLGDVPAGATVVGNPAHLLVSN